MKVYLDACCPGRITDDHLADDVDAVEAAPGESGQVDGEGLAADDGAQGEPLAFPRRIYLPPEHHRSIRSVQSGRPQHNLAHVRGRVQGCQDPGCGAGSMI